MDPKVALGGISGITEEEEEEQDEENPRTEVGGKKQEEEDESFDLIQEGFEKVNVEEFVREEEEEEEEEEMEGEDVRFIKVETPLLRLLLVPPGLRFPPLRSLLLRIPPLNQWPMVYGLPRYNNKYLTTE
eukprot:Nk52_evm30s296 gene=Nk52_evmTU30s296